MNHILQEDARGILNQDISWEKFDGKRILVTGAGEIRSRCSVKV